MVHDVDTVYLATRRDILAGKLAPDHVIASEDIGRIFGLNEKKSRAVLSSLTGDGYLIRSRVNYSVRRLTHEEVEEWHQTLCALVELGAVRLVLDGVRNHQHLQRLGADKRAAAPAHDEQFYLWQLELLAALLGGQHASLTAFANQLVPPMFFRLLWLAGIETDAVEVLQQAVRSVSRCTSSGADARAASEACRAYFDAVAPALHGQLDRRNAGACPDLLDDLERTVERRINGHVNYLRAPSGPKQLLPRLTANEAASVKGFVPG